MRCSKLLTIIVFQTKLAEILTSPTPRSLFGLGIHATKSFVVQTERMALLNKSD